MGNALVMLALCAVFAATFADIGPGPEKPAISVYLKQNSTPYTGISSITFVCAEPIVGNDTESPVGDRTAELACSGGTCTNNAWFYKFNPCFYGTGYFSYSLDGKELKTESFSFSKPGSYSIEIDVDKGTTTQSGSTTCSTSALIMLALLGFVAFRE